MSVRWIVVAVILVILLAVVGIAALSVRAIWGGGTVVSVDRPVSDFSALNFQGFGELTIVQGETEGLTIEAGENMLRAIETTVTNGTLIIRHEAIWRTMIRSPRPPRYTLRVRDLTALAMSGAGQVTMEGLTTPSFALHHSGAGEVILHNLTVDQLAVTLSGAGDVQLSGTATEQSVQMSGLSSYAAGDLESVRADVDLSGAGSVTVWVTEELDASLSGAGSIRYYGSPEVNRSVSGAGSIESLGAK